MGPQRRLVGSGLHMGSAAGAITMFAGTSANTYMRAHPKWCLRHNRSDSRYVFSRRIFAPSSYVRWIWNRGSVTPAVNGLEAKRVRGREVRAHAAATQPLRKECRHVGMQAFRALCRWRIWIDGRTDREGCRRKVWIRLMGSSQIGSVCRASRDQQARALEPCEGCGLEARS